MKTVFFLLLVLLFPTHFAHSATKSSCPEKKFDSGVVEGTLLEIYCDIYCQAILETEDGQTAVRIAEEDAEKWFGSGTGQRVSIQYDMIQYWDVERGECQRIESAVAGKPHSVLSASAQEPEERTAEPAGVPKATEEVRPPGKTYVNSLGMEFVLIPAGSFSRKLEKPVTNEFGEVLHDTQTVRISKTFYLGKHEVTQEQWVAVMGSNPSDKKGRQKPVDNVSWNDAQEFIKRLNEREGTNRYRLPTEAEWEFAARGGTDTRCGNAVTAKSVGQKKTNSYGLYDRYGNVREWVQDWYAELPTGQITDYRGPSSGSNRVFRGGGRGSGPPDGRLNNLGFRLILSPE